MSVDPQFQEALLDASDPWHRVMEALYPEALKDQLREDYGTPEALKDELIEDYGTPQEWVNRSTKNWLLTDRPKEYAQLKASADKAREEMMREFRKQHVTDAEANALIGKRHNKTEFVMRLKTVIEQNSLAQGALDVWPWRTEYIEPEDVDEDDLDQDQQAELEHKQSNDYYRKHGEAVLRYLRR